VESKLRFTGCGGVPVLRGLAEACPSPVACHGNAAIPHLFLGQEPGGDTVYLEVELSVCEGASQCTNTTSVRQMLYTDAPAVVKWYQLLNDDH